MSRGFGATLGAGTTDKINLPSALHSLLQTWHIVVNRHGAGGSDLGRIWNGVTLIHSFHNDSTFSGGMRINFDFSVTDGGWSIPLLTADTWRTVTITYDASSVLNDPVCYVDGASVTVTDIVAPAGTFDTTTQNVITLGNRSSDNARIWDGQEAEFGRWSRILTAGEIAGLATGLTPMHFPEGLVDYVPMLRENWGKLGPATITGTVVQPHPRTIYPRSRRMVFSPAVSGSSPPSTGRRVWAGDFFRASA